MFKMLFGAMTIMAASAGFAHAALNAYDGFTGYPAGDLTGNNGGSGWNGAYTDSGNSTIVETTGLTYLNLQTTGGKSRTNDGGGVTTINFRNLNAIYGDDETETWISFVGRRNGATATNLFAGVSLYNSNGTGTADGEVSFASTTAGTVLWRVLDLGGAASTNSTVAINSDTNYFLLARIIWNTPDLTLAGPTTAGNDAVYLYVNPTIGGAAPSTASASAARNVTITNFDKIRIAGQNAVDFSFDEIRIGSTFADVTPTIPSNTDFNGVNGTDLADFDILRANYLTGTTNSVGDANFDGIVNHQDFFLWRTAYLGSGGSLADFSFDAVPEPATLLLMACITVGGFGFTRPSRQLRK